MNISMFPYLRINATCVINLSIDLLDANARGSRTVQVPHGVQTHITKTLKEQTPTILKP